MFKKLVLVGALTLSPVVLFAQGLTPKHGEVRRIKVHGRSLERKLKGTLPTVMSLSTYRRATPCLRLGTIPSFIYCTDTPAATKLGLDPNHW